MEEWNLGKVPITVNGELVGEADATDTLVEVVRRSLRAAHIQSASAFGADGRKLLTADGPKSLEELGLTELNIVTKDQRA